MLKDTLEELEEKIATIIDEVLNAEVKELIAKNEVKYKTKLLNEMQLTYKAYIKESE